ncbi:hypothetical protein CMESO_338 (nucleomorph) [Chroomonas mesostigmatica CCMP1168]|uniref:Uncharacterized protein n=1 Tax=Chroomonas mesostigmatica CCMP1168 TaxID=1195612 RepID=J7GAK3_9CRYP|nr:hypothetical protein CMESO_338 [Chroomonas mesostigmatica CCMP1168]
MRLFSGSVDLNSSYLSLFRLDTQSLIKTSFFTNFREKIETLKNKGILNFITPTFSKYIRIVSQNSFELISFFQKLTYPSEKTEKIFFHNFFLVGFNFLNLFIQSNYLGPRVIFKKIHIISSLFFIDFFGLDVISRNHKISLIETEFIELFSISKGILLEGIGKHFQKCPEIFGWAYRFLLLYFKSIDIFPLKYRWGFMFLFLGQNFESDIKNRFSFLFLSPKFLNSNLRKWKFGLYDEFLLLKANTFIEIFFFCSAYSRKNRIKFLLKAKHMICYKVFLSGFMNMNFSHQLHFSPQNLFSFAVNDKNDCIGENVKTKNEKKILSSNSLSVKRFEIQTNRNCDVLNQKKNANCLHNFNFFPTKEPNKSSFSNSFSTDKKQPFISLKIGFSVLFFLNLAFVVCYSVSTSISVLFRFLGDLSFHDLNNFKKFCLVLFFFSIKKKGISYRKTELVKICGIKIELFLKSSLSKERKNIFLNHFWNLNCIFLINRFSSWQKILANCYNIFGFFDYSKIITKNFKSKKLFYKNLFFMKNSKIIEIKIRKFNELTNIENTSIVFVLLGNFTKKNKYFEIISKREFICSHLSKQFLGSWYCERKKWIQAKKQISLSILINPKNKNSLFQLGFVSLKTKDFSTAVRSFLKILQEEPWNKYAWSNLSSIFSSNFKKKDICYIFLKEVIKTKKVPLFIFKKFLLFCLNPKKLKLMNVIESIKNFFQQNFGKKKQLSDLFLKLLISFVEIFSKKNILFLGKKIINLIFFEIFWNLFYFENLIYLIKFDFFKQNGFLKHQFNHKKKKNMFFHKSKNKLNSKSYQKLNEKIEKTVFLFFLY